MDSNKLETDFKRIFLRMVKIILYGVSLFFVLIALLELFVLVVYWPVKAGNPEFPEPDWNKRFSIIAVILICSLLALGFFALYRTIKNKGNSVK